MTTLQLLNNMDYHSKNQKPKKILIFSLVYYPRNIGGAEVAIKEITDRISPEEFRFDMVTLAKSGPFQEKVGNVNAHRVGWIFLNTTKIFGKFYKYLFIFFAFWKACRLHRRNRYDLIWAVMANYAGFGAMFFKFLHPSVPFVLTLQEGDPISHIKRRVGILYPLFRKIFTKADAIQAISNYLAGWAGEMGARAPLSVVPNGVDGRKFQITNSKSQKEEKRKAFGLGAEDTVLITTSRLVEKNAVKDIIKALQYLPENVKLFILGTGGLLKNLQLTAGNLGLENRVRFFGFVSHDKLPEYLWASDIFIRPSRSEGMGNSFIEAMAAGLPVIATPVGGIPDFLSDGETGLFCEVGNPQSIAEKVEKLTKDAESREYIIKNALTLVRQKYDWSLIARRMKEEIFEPLT